MISPKRKRGHAGKASRNARKVMRKRKRNLHRKDGQAHSKIVTRHMPISARRIKILESTADARAAAWIRLLYGGMTSGQKEATVNNLVSLGLKRKDIAVLVPGLILEGR